jgi:uncharacterized RDD family membrane protein YckC
VDGGSFGESQGGWNARPADLASPGRRFGGFLIDALIIGTVNIILFVSQFDLDFESGNVPEVPMSLRLGTLAVTSLYMVAFVAWRGQTPGKMAVATRIVDAETGVTPSVAQAVIRWGVPGLLGLLPTAGLLVFVVYLWLTWDPNRQGLHDKAARTLVVNVAS